MDRISRNIVDFYQLYQMMELHGVEFSSMSEDFDTSTLMGRAMMGILIVFAQMERESIQERVKDNYCYRIREDERWPGGPAPKGFDNARTKDNKPTLRLNADIEMVKIAFDSYANDANISLSRIARELSAKGYKSSRESGVFDSVTIGRILKNPVYAVADGLLYQYFKTQKVCILNEASSWDGSTSAHIVGKRQGNACTGKYTKPEEQIVYKTNFMGIIPSKTYIMVQERLARNEKIGRANAPGKMEELAGFVKCAKCGYAVKMNHPPNLSCYGRSSLHVCDASIHMKFPGLQEKVGLDLQKQLDMLLQKIFNCHACKEQERNRITQINEEIERLVRLAAIGSMDVEQVKEAIEERKKKINEIKLSLLKNASFWEETNIPNRQPLIFRNLDKDEKKICCTASYSKNKAQ